MTVYATMDSPVGELLLAGEQAGGGLGLRSVSMPGQPGAPTPQPGWNHDPAAFAEAIRQLAAYFAGELTVFDLELAPDGTAFQRRVWQALDTIPYGTTTSYGRLAAQLGEPPDRIQAVAAAVGANPLLIVRPCHRVVGADGTMRGYAAGVLRKQQLLAHEGALLPG
ncbi:MAG: methylated-DNA--[protein]-cysteine S-methyltransferase [Streptosporangiaceae bacterium]|nr:methylated-DNA--[protein]-cysteine S-methyltransferase [Streptosporangiaceae bacterium]